MDFLGSRDPVRQAMLHAEQTPPEYLYWSIPYTLQRLRMRFGLTRRELAARAGVSPSAVGRVEKGADLRVGTLYRLFGALGCRPVILPGGGLYDLDFEDARLDDDWVDWKRGLGRYGRRK